MLPKAHLTTYSSISGFMWVTPASSLSQSLWPFLYSSSVHSCYLFLISSASVRSLNFLSFIVPNFAWSIPMESSVFLKRSILFTIYYFPLILELFTYKDFLISPCYSLKVCISLGISFPFCLLYTSLIFQLFWRPPQATTLPAHICFSWGWFWSLLLVQCYKPPSIIFQATRPNPLNLFFISTA